MRPGKEKDISVRAQKPDQGRGRQSDDVKISRGMGVEESRRRPDGRGEPNTTERGKQPGRETGNGRAANFGMSLKSKGTPEDCGLTVAKTEDCHTGGTTRLLWEMGEPSDKYNGRRAADIGMTPEPRGNSE